MFQRRFLWACGGAIALLFSASIHVVADREPAQSASTAAVPRAQAPLRLADARSGQAPASSAAPTLPDQALIQKYCASCHNDRAKTAGISFDGINVAEAGKHSEIFEKALVKLHGG
jgi:cytochrome c5